jgi:hypothetical protein
MLFEVYLAFFPPHIKQVCADVFASSFDGLCLLTGIVHHLIFIHHNQKSPDRL